MNPSAEAKITSVPARLPRIGSFLRQSERGHCRGEGKRRGAHQRDPGPVQSIHHVVGTLPVGRERPGHARTASSILSP